MAARDELKQALLKGDFKLCRAMWRTWFPDMPQPKTDGEAEIQLHLARTSMAGLPLLPRAYSHRWLTERSLPSLLPDNLRPKAEQMVPKVTPVVGFAWGSGHKLLQLARPIIEEAVHERIRELDGDGMLTKDPALVKREMLLTKDCAVNALFGRFDALLKEGVRE